MLRPLNGRVVVKREAPAEMAGKIHIPETARAFRGELATVLAVGPGRKLTTGEHLKPAVNVGDVVYLPEMCGVEVRYQGELLSMVTEDEIVGVAWQG